jgi:phage baseplate assembly protein W
MYLDFPFHVDARGRTATAGEDKNVRDLIELVLFTAPGERVNRPDFGCGLQQLIFGPSSSDMAATVQGMVQGALQQWLGELIRVDGVEVRSADSTLQVTVVYTLIRDQSRYQAVFEREVTP